MPQDGQIFTDKITNAKTDGNKIFVFYQLAMTTIDGKVCDGIVGTESTLSCYLRKATSKDEKPMKFCKKKCLMKIYDTDCPHCMPG